MTGSMLWQRVDDSLAYLYNRRISSALTRDIVTRDLDSARQTKKKKKTCVSVLDFVGATL